MSEDTQDNAAVISMHIDRVYTRLKKNMKSLVKRTTNVENAMRRIKRKVKTHVEAKLIFATDRQREIIVEGVTDRFIANNNVLRQGQ